MELVIIWWKYAAKECVCVCMRAHERQAAIYFSESFETLPAFKGSPAFGEYEGVQRLHIT